MTACCSGGYYIAMDLINLANPDHHGSIRIGIVPTLKNSGKLGINTDGLGTTSIAVVT